MSTGRTKPMRLAALALVALIVLMLARTTQAHEATDASIPDQPGLRLGAALALSVADARHAWPATRLPGVFNAGTTPQDRQGDALEHATLDLGLRLNARLGAAVAWGWHDNDPPHLEAAWAQWTQPWGEDTLLLGAGRNRLPMGQVLENAGHFDRFAAIPLAKRAVLDDDWIDDGVSLRWDRSHDGPLPALQTVQLGWWRARHHPGGDGAPWAPALHVHLEMGDVALDGFASSVRPQQRGAYIQNALAAHTHEKPDCSASLVGITCFDGRSDVLGAALGWSTPLHGWRVQAGALMRRDRGTLFSASGDADYRGSTGGGWVDLLWAPSAKWGVAARVESVRSVQTLEGAAALAVATDAGLLGNGRTQRATLAVSFAPMTALRLSAEAGRERAGGQNNPFTVLRLVWTPDALLQHRW